MLLSVVLCQSVDVPVEAGAPGIAAGLLQLGVEVLLRLLLCHPQDKSISDIVQVVDGAQFWDPCLQHHGQQVDEEGCPSTEDEVGILTETDKSGRKGEREEM